MLAASRLCYTRAALDDYAVQGKLRIRSQDFERDLQFIKERVGEVSNARLVSFPGFDFIKFWWVDFAATREQWAALEPELAPRGIMATMYEAPGLAAEAGDQPAARVHHSSSLRWIPYACIGVCVIALALAIFLRDWALPLCGAAALALLGALLSGAFVALMEY